MDTHNIHQRLIMKKKRIYDAEDWRVDTDTVGFGIEPLSAASHVTRRADSFDAELGRRGRQRHVDSWM
jgi:hypothetical protein